MFVAGGQVEQDKYAGEESGLEADILPQDMHHFYVPRQAVILTTLYPPKATILVSLCQIKKPAQAATPSSPVSTAS